MTIQTLTYSQRLLLQRYFDDDVQEGTESFEQAQRLVDDILEAQQWVESLEELAIAVRAAEQNIWEDAPERTSGQIVDQVFNAKEDLSLQSLAPMLERFHDDEMSSEERAYLEPLLNEQEEVASYLGALEEVRQSVQSSHEEALDGVDFSNFFASIESRLDEDEVVEAQPAPAQEKVIQFPGKPKTTERPAFNMEEHQLLLARYFDGEASDDERAQVIAWAEIDQNVSETLDVFGELALSTRAAIDELNESVEFTQLWSNVESALAKDFAQGPNVISLDVARAQKEEAPKPQPARFKREIFIAMAAAVLSIFGVGLFGDKFFPTQTTVVEKTVVIVDSVEYQQGSSGMVMQPASMLVDEKQPQTPEPKSETIEVKEEESPTIIWILDEDQKEKAAPSDAQNKEVTPSTKPKKVNNQPI